MRYSVLVFLLFAVPALAAPVSPGLLDDDSPVLTYTGSWVESSESYAIGGAARSASSGSITFDMYADGLTVYFLYSTGGGDMDVCIDSDCVTVSTDGGGASGRVDVTGLGTGLKSVSISPSSATSISFDALYIYPNPPDGADTAIRSISSEFVVTEDETEVTYTGRYILSYTAGEITLAVLVSVLIIIQTGNLVMWLWYRA